MTSTDSVVSMTPEMSVAAQWPECEKPRRTVSVLICTYNGSERLGSVVDCLAKQGGLAADDWELIAVDNASTDTTKQVLCELMADFPAPCRVISESKPGKAYALETAFRHAQGELYCVVDDDNLLEPDYLANGTQFLHAHPDAAVIGGKTQPMFPDAIQPPNDFDERFASLLACRDHGNDVIWGFRPPGAGQMGRVGLMKRIYRDIGTRLEDRVGDGVGCCEDLEKSGICARLGWKTAYVPSLRLHHVMTERRLTESYIDELACAAVQTSAWLRLVADAEPLNVFWQAFCIVRYSIRSWKYRTLGWLPKELHPKLARASHWSRFYASRADGYRSLLSDRSKVRSLIESIENAPDAMRANGVYRQAQ